MKRIFFSITMVVGLMIGVSGQMVSSQSVHLDQAPAPTLIPPTPIPREAAGEQEVLPSESTVARIQANGVVRVGILYNAPPFGELSIRGEHAGYDADLARSMAETWGVEVEFVQVTRQAEDSARLLRNGAVDMLVAAQVHTRELDALFEFSQAYYMGQQSVMVRADDGATEPAQMANRTLGVVIASPAQNAVNAWATRNGMTVPVRTFLTIDQAYSALLNNQVDGIVDSDYRLRQVSAVRPEATRILAAAIEVEPFAIAVLRQDVSMRNLVNRTLQYLTATERLHEINEAHFPGERYDVITVGNNLGEDAPTPGQYPTNLAFPSTYAVPQIQANGVVRVAGLIGGLADDPNAPESERRLDALHRQLLQQMAVRWGVSVEFIPNSAANGLELVATGQADIAFGVAPDWNWADRVDFTGGYLVHGERLMVRSNYAFETFEGLRGGMTVITPMNEATAASRAVAIAETINAGIEISQQREQDLTFAMLDDLDLDAEAVFGDSLRLVPHVLARPDALRLTHRDNGEHWYSRVMMTMAVPRNDIDFRLLVEYTLQELILEGTLNSLLQPLMLPEDIPTFEIWPGSSNYLGLSLGRP
jgi:polar amino acid transport system substrate-binding protein